MKMSLQIHVYHSLGKSYSVLDGALPLDAGLKHAEEDV